ncbi:MAG: FtsW/RodA/SpoVE family cell cycle protein [Chloroflexi bacterium]|nr:FtsW/RodA/SpoVE family cell cycle protein [Chloroflexota bacterium]MCL5076381.1 FtsW/RodA/SpoVE family cell cycle protein [Chloroflexota bacterium]
MITFVGLFLGLWIWLTLRCFHGDQLLLPIVAMLCALGLTIVSRLEPNLLLKQVIWIASGIGIMSGVIAFPRDLLWLKRYKYTWAILGLFLVALTLLLGTDPSHTGTRLWFSFAGIYFQPSEILKVLLVIFLAAYLDDKRELLAFDVYRIGFLRLPPLPYLGPLLTMWGLSIILLVGQKDLGATFLLFGIFLAMLYVASSRGTYVWGGLILFLIAAYIAYHLSPHVQGRVDIWLNPWRDPGGASYQVVQSLVAFASGGLFGVGLNWGHPDIIPAVHTDFPLAAIGEELGLSGTIAIVSLYLLLIYRGFRTALSSPHSFDQLLAAGLTTIIAIQSLVIISGNLGLLPLTGITLPFVSYGGSSMVANFIVIGLLLRISHESKGQ